MSKDKISEYNEVFSLLNNLVDLLQKVPDLRSNTNQYSQHLSSLVTPLMLHTISKIKSTLLYLDSIDSQE